MTEVASEWHWLE